MSSDRNITAEEDYLLVLLRINRWQAELFVSEFNAFCLADDARELTLLEYLRSLNSRINPPLSSGN